MTGPWTNVARDSDGDPREWCAHWHEDAEAAYHCAWVPSDPSWDVYIESFYNFDPVAATPCVHELHSAECLRCLALVCIHLNWTVDCERCIQEQTTDPNTGDGDEVQE